MSNIIYITEEGLNKLKKELDHLIKVERPAVSRQIAEARDKGDLSENAEYDVAKENQGHVELKINKLQEAINNARIIDMSLIDLETVQIFNVVKIRNLKTKAVMEYRLVSESESNIKEKKISVNAPIAQGLLGKKVGDIVDVKVPNGQISLEILEISI